MRFAAFRYNTPKIYYNEEHDCSNNKLQFKS